MASFERWVVACLTGATDPEQRVAVATDAAGVNPQGAVMAIAARNVELLLASL